MYITELEKLKGGRILVRTEEGIRFPLYRKEVDLYGLEPETELPEALYTQICEEVLKTRARKRVLYLLQRSDRTEAELRRKLSRDGYPEELIQQAIAYADSYHYIDDFRYACNYIRYSGGSKNRRQLQIFLQQKGVDPETMARAFDEAYSDNEEALAGKALAKRGYDPGTADEAERRKQYAYLARKGYSDSVISKVLKEDADF